MGPCKPGRLRKGCTSGSIGETISHSVPLSRKVACNERSERRRTRNSTSVCTSTSTASRNTRFVPTIRTPILSANSQTLGGRSMVNCDIPGEGNTVISIRWTPSPFSSGVSLAFTPIFEGTQCSLRASTASQCARL